MNLRTIVKDQGLLANHGAWYVHGPDHPGRLSLRFIDLPRSHPLRQYMGETSVDIGNLCLLSYVNQDILEILAYGGVLNFLASVEEFNWKIDMPKLKELRYWAQQEHLKLEQVNAGLTK